MPSYRRAHVPGGTFFFTVVTYSRRRLFDSERNRSLLGEAMRECQQDWPFKTNAIVLLPDHLHAIWTLPRGDDQYSGRWSVIKKNFTQKFLDAGGEDWAVSRGKLNQNRRGIWQPRFWEHTLEDEDDFEAHFDYIHYNPVKHRYVRCPREWGPSSFHRWVRQGVYPHDWACGRDPSPDFSAIENDAGEPV